MYVNEITILSVPVCPHQLLNQLVYEAQSLLGCTAVLLIGCRLPIKNMAVHPRKL
jgi:hypothetical protein